MAAVSHRIAYVGRRAQDPWLEAASLYQRRLKNSMPVEMTLIRQSDTARERQLLLETILAHEFVIALDERGVEQTTRQFAAGLSKLYDSGHKRILWLIGGAEGLGDTLRLRADRIWQLSRLTLPHRAALALLLEQLFRADAVLKNLPYHRD